MDFSFLNKKAVVLCRTKEEARQFIRQVVKEIPEIEETMLLKCGAWDREHDSEGLAYRITKIGRGSYDTGFCSANWYRGCNYEVLEYQSLIAHPDFGAIESGFEDSTAALAALF